MTYCECYVDCSMIMNKQNIYEIMLNHLEGEIEVSEVNIEVSWTDIETLEHDNFFSHVLVSTASCIFLAAHIVCLTYTSFSILYHVHISKLEPTDYQVFT